VTATEVSVIDYGAGNLGNARRAIEELGFPQRLVELPEQIAATGPILLPGVGNYGSAMETINRSGVAEAIRKAAGEGRRIVGICLGLQMMFSRSEEAPGVNGIGILAGRVRRLNVSDQTLPHLGWCPVGPSRTPLYFAHSFVVEPEDRSVIKATAEWGETFPAIIERGQVMGFQFHPERSGDPGLELLSHSLTGQELRI
jgi:imidazole glycerol phosphate synthase glutamine amidotransferase subunit